MNSDLGPSKKSALYTVYEDEYLICVDKPSGLMVHSGLGEKIGPFLLDRLQELCAQKLYPAHRLDRPTSGAIIFAKDSKTAAALQKSWKENVQKEYLAAVKGHFLWAQSAIEKLSNEKGIKKEATTSLIPLGTIGKGSLVLAQPKTGRMHQIRKHLVNRKHFILGDRIYGKGRINNEVKEMGLSRLFLHAFGLSLIHPITQKRMNLIAPLPKELTEFIDRMCQHHHEKINWKKQLKEESQILPLVDNDHWPF